MESQAIITLLVILVSTYMLAFTRISIDFSYLLIVIVFAVTGVLTPQEAFSGFVSNTSLTLAFLTILVVSVKKTGGMHYITKTICGTSSSFPARVLVRILSWTSLLTMFISNTALATILFPNISDWARRHNILPSKLILPVSHIISIASNCTIIGSSHTLLALGMYSQFTGGEVSFFTPFATAFPCTIIAILLSFMLYKYIPECKDKNFDVINDRKFVIEMMIPSDNNIIGKNVSDIPAFNANGIKLIKMYHFDDVILSPIPGDEYLMGGDRLVFHGDYPALMALRQELGLVCSNDFVLNSKKFRESKKLLQGAVVAANSSLKYSMISNTDFEKTHNVTLVAMMRQGDDLIDSPRNTEIHGGDLLMFEGQELKWDALTNDLLPYGDTSESQYDNRKKYACLAVLVFVIAGSALKLFPIALGCCVGVMLLGALRCINCKTTWDSIPWNQLLMITGSSTIGIAVHNSGLADMASDVIRLMCGGLSSFFPLALILLVAMLSAQIFSAYTCVAILMPIGISTATALGQDPLAFALAVMFAVSSDFLTFFTSSKLVMAMTHGAYTSKELFRFGIPYFVVMYFAYLISIITFFHI